MESWFYASISVFLVSLISLIGILGISLRQGGVKRISHLFVSLAIGALFGDSLIHLVPESFTRLGINLKTSLLILLGIVGFLLLEKILQWRHCHLPTSKNHPHPLGLMNLVGDGLHNLIDGVIIGVGYLSSFRVGLATTLAIILHEIPQEIGDFGVLIHAGFSFKKAIILNFLSGLIAIFGTSLVFLFGSLTTANIIFFIPLAAGGFLYLAGADLVPEIKTECKPTTSLLQFSLIILGITIMSLLRFLG